MNNLRKFSVFFTAVVLLLVSCEDKAKKLEQEKMRIADSIAYVDSIARVQFVFDSMTRAKAVMDSLTAVRVADSLAAVAKVGKTPRKAPAKAPAKTTPKTDGPSKGGAPGTVEPVKPGKGGAPGSTESAPIIKPGKGGAPGGGGR